MALASLWCGVPSAYGASPIDLGAADPFAVLGGSTVTSAGTSTITGDLGVSPGTVVTGFPPGTVSGSIRTGGAAAEAHSDLAAAFAVAAARSPSQAVGTLGGLTLEPGVYAAGAEMTLEGTVTLDGGGDPGAVFVFQAGSTLITGAGSRVALTGGTQACNVFWQVGSSATLGASSVLKGSILAATSISMSDGVAIDGRALARDGAVSLIGNTVSVSHCAGELTNTAPALTPFSATLTGLTQSVRTAVGGWSVYDTRGNGAGYNVTVAATAPTVDGSASAAGTGASLTLTPRAPSPSPGNAATAGPVPAGPQALGFTAATVAVAAPGSGRGGWDFPADTGDLAGLELAIPGDARAGAFSSTLTFTTAPPAA